MATDTVLSDAGYRKLRRELSALLEAGRRMAESAVGHVLATTYWEVGRRILKAELTDRAGYGAGVLEELSRDLEISVRNLQHALRFARLYEEAPREGLSWANYRELLGVADEGRRRFLEDAALEQGWSRRVLSAAIKGGAFVAEASTANVNPAALPAGGVRGKLKRPTDANYVYRCEVVRVIDGDSLIIELDLGFDVLRRQRLRLVNVDAQPADTQSGQAATHFVRRQLAQALTVAVKTARSSDARGRYLAHVFYSGKELDADSVFKKGRYLNAALLEAGHAVLAPDS